MFTIDSCGTAAYHVGQPPDSRTVKECSKNNVPINHKARQIKLDDFYSFDYILCMDKDNLADVLKICPKDATAEGFCLN